VTKNRSSKSERGQALIVIVLALVGLVGIAALAVDGGNAFLQSRRAQQAADDTALGAALARIRTGPAWVYTAYQLAAHSGYNNDGVTNEVQVFSPPISGPYQGDIEYIQVIISARSPTYLAAAIGIGEVTSRAEAVARTKTPVIAEILDGNAVISLAPESDCGSQPAFWVHGEATLDISNAGVFVNSDHETCALMQSGSGSIRIDGGQISVVGGADIKKPELLTPFPPETGATAISYPPPFMMPKFGCAQEAVISADGSTMSAGTWEDVFPPEGVHFLDAGVYCLNGDFVVGGGYALSGNNVVFKVEHGSVRWHGDAQLDLGAPTGGELAGLLIYLPMDNDSRVVLNGGSTASVRGTILAPASEIKINGNDSATGFHSQIIGYRIDVDGNSNVVIRYNDDQNYDALTMPEIELVK
jgi:hypothetical protein